MGRVTLREWLAEGRYSLAMSSGFFGFYAHTGMLSALVENGHAPIGVSGSSAGALVGGAWAAGVEHDALANELRALSRDDFWDPKFGVGILAGRKFDALMRKMLPIPNIDQCRVPTRISVFDILARKTTVLERGDLSNAIRASCAVPVMFHPVKIEGRSYWDGGILDRPGIVGVPPGERLLLHYLTPPSLPKRDGMITLVIDGLPPANPWRLDNGRRALDLARATTERALDTPIVNGVVRLAA